MLSATRHLKEEIQVEEMKLELTKTEIKSEYDEEVTVDTAVLLATKKLPSEATLQFEDTSLLILKCEPDCKKEPSTSSASSVPDNVTGKDERWGKCPICPRQFVRDRSGFQEISRHIFNCHRTTGHSRNMLLLRMANCSPNSYRVIQRRLQASLHASNALKSGRVLRSHKKKLTGLASNSGSDEGRQKKLQ
ncbi:39S ribosomal protein L37, mitochondrial [Frankliniella fusca]|uniref:39S ribosomal protein L37, mitochondrial n=1 Tax=Frankliniella fusca TaxID=407009 RepID=A0AAE1GQN5_9NEOP|nr:39S ribosomal protein L37, mitochondrial [Frankliniella fusca]KAK3922458.1 39S ribosomal protein L37, mitochondrial [Frankliniella fusca]